MAEKIVPIEATSGIGRALAIEMHHRGYIVSPTGRRIQRLKELRKELSERIHIQPMDVTPTENATEQLDGLTDAMGGMNIMVLNAGVSNLQESSGRETDLKVIDVNVKGFANLAAYSFNKFEEQLS